MSRAIPDNVAATRRILAMQRAVRVRSPYREAERAADHAVHIIALVAASAGAVAMVTRAAVSADLLTFFAALVYSLALLAMLGASAAHNRGRSRAGEEFRRRIDHAAIFVMIAGTYTPFTMRLLSGGLAIGLTAGIWALALVGALMKLRYPRHFGRLSIVIYLGFGWLGLFLVPSLFASLPQPAAFLIVAGGGLYSVGAAFHVWKTLPFQNAIWHGFVVLAAGCHYAAIWQAVVVAGT
jgi:hemolysin III